MDSWPRVPNVHATLIYFKIMILFSRFELQALESQQARKYLGDWIDLVFGYKQTGKAAIQAINVFHPSVSTYYSFEN